MPRRTPYTKLEKENFTRAPHVKGKGDVLFRGFECLNPACQNFLFIADSEIGEDFSIPCPECGFTHRAGDSTRIYDYKLRDLARNAVIEEGSFEILHDDYVNEAKAYKYCIICSALKPIELFDRHSSRQSGRQGECTLCKQTYNEIKNQSRIPEQHREASQKRRLYTELTSSPKLDIARIYDKFENRCFKCKIDLSADRDRGRGALRGNLDHTLPVKWLWPLTTETATLLCKAHNADKADAWPSDFYTDQELRSLSPLVGISYRSLKGRPLFNPEAIQRLHDPQFVEAIFQKYARYTDEMISLRNRILRETGFDFFSVWKNISADWINKADALL